MNELLKEIFEKTKINTITNSNIISFFGKFNALKNNDGILYKEILHKKFQFTSKPAELMFLEFNDMKSRPICPICNKNELSFNTFLSGYFQFCSVKCSKNDPIVQKERMNKIKINCLEKYGTEYYFQTYEFKEKFKQISNEKYGCDNPFQNEEVKEKHKKTMKERYGVDHYSKTDEFKIKYKNTNLKKRGVDNPRKDLSVIKKGQITCLERYGFLSPNKCKEVRNKIDKTNLERYGYKNISQSPEVKQKVIESFRKTFYNNLLTTDRLQDKVTPLFTLEEYKGSKSKNGSVKNYIYKWKCNECGSLFEDSVENGTVPRCFNCYPKLSGSSKMEKEISSFCKIYYPNLIENSREIIPPLELDIYIPEINLAIEFHGLYWHSEITGNKDKNYHLNKYLECKKQNITLVQIFEDEWMNKQDIVKSMLLNKVKKITKKVFARKCEIIEVSNKEACKFYENNHINGQINSTISLGLINDNKLISLLSFAKPRFNKNFDYEITRFCNKLNYSIPGGFSKLLKYFMKKYTPKNIITYADLRYGEGNVYLNNGFEYSGISNPNYYYIRDGFFRQTRIQFQKHKLEEKLKIFDSKLTEWQNMQLNGYDRIWDVGNKIYTYNS